MEKIRFDFALLLFSLTVFTGVIWLIDHLFFAKKRIAASTALGKAPKDPGLVDLSKSFFPVILIVFLIRSFLAEPFKIPSNSMMPTLLTGDFILVNKFTYGIRLPVLNKKIIEWSEPKRGDVVVFRYPGMGPDDPNIGQDYIKRVIGVPGDEVSYYNRVLSINGVPISNETVGTYTGIGSGLEMTGWIEKREDLLGVQHSILDHPYDAAIAEGAWQIRQGEYMVFGDNRDRSADSRFWGMVPEQNLVGKAMIIWFNWDGKAGSPSFGRIGTKIR